MSLLSALCPSDLFVESLMQCLSLSLCSILRCMVEVPVGAAWRPLSSWLQEIWSFVWAAAHTAVLCSLGSALCTQRTAGEFPPTSDSRREWEMEMLRLCPKSPPSTRPVWCGHFISVLRSKRSPTPCSLPWLQAAGWRGAIACCHTEIVHGAHRL